MPDFGVKTAVESVSVEDSETTFEAVLKRVLAKTAYRPLWQDTPGYKTLVDEKSTKGILPSQTEESYNGKGQGRLDAVWPVQLEQSREKERALPIPSEFDKNRETQVGPTTYNKNRNTPVRTRAEPGEQVGNPTKFDYNYVRRRKDVTAVLKEVTTLLKTAVMPLPKPNQRQRKLKPSYKRVVHQWYLRNRPRKKLKEKLKYRTKGKRDPQAKKYRQYYRKYPNRYKRRGQSPLNTPADRTKAWRETQSDKARDTGQSQSELKKQRERSQTQKTRSRSPSTPGTNIYASIGRLAALLEHLAGSPNWETQVKKTEPPEVKPVDKGTPRSDQTVQKGESLRAPNLDDKPQIGLKWEIKPKAPGSLPFFTVNNPGAGSGKVIPMWGDFVNNTQQVPDGGSDQYLHNDNFEVKTAASLSEILSRVDSKIKTRAALLAPVLERTDTKNWLWTWRVGDHVVRVQAFKRGAAKNLPKLNLRVSCSCPYWRWWGPEHWSKQEDYLRGALQGTASVPKIRDPNHVRPVCKHAYAVLERSKKFFVRPEKNPLRRLAVRFSVDSPEIRKVALMPATSHACERDIVHNVTRRYLGGGA